MEFVFRERCAGGVMCVSSRKYVGRLEFRCDCIASREKIKRETTRGATGPFGGSSECVNYLYQAKALNVYIVLFTLCVSCIDVRKISTSPRYRIRTD